MASINWHNLETNSALEELISSSETGLSTPEAEKRLEEHGENQLIERGGRTIPQIILQQASTLMVWILVVAAAISVLLGDDKNAIAILAIIALYTFLGFIQEYRAEKTVAVLKKLSVPNVRVLRDGNLKELPAKQLVPGDILQLEAGNVIPADVRLLEAVSLRIQEALLTGEFESIQKHTVAVSGEDLPLGDRRNMAYMGTLITQGRGLALVVATGMKTELGKIADLIQQVKQEQTPLQRKLEMLGKHLALISLAITIMIFIIGLLRGNELRDMLLAIVSVAVAIVPAGLPIVVTITLALGAQRMMEYEVLIKKLPAVDTLGAVTVICSDKTGTLTENRMTVVVLDVAEHALDLTEEMGRSGSLRTTRRLGTPAQSSLSLAAIGGALCNDAKLIDTGDDRYHTLGDPTEGALVVAAAKMGYWKSSLDISFPRATEHSFDNDRKRMTTVHHLGQYDPEVLSGLDVSDKRYIAFTKGRVENLLDIISHVWVDGKAFELDAGWRSKIEAATERLAKKGMRVIGVGYRLLNAIPEIIQTDLEHNVTLVGLFGMIDPPRNEVKEAVAVCRAAGIRPVMITGDHPLTAIEIARQLGITENGRALSDVEIDNLAVDELKNVIDEVSVFARVAPEHKLKIVQALQAKGHIVSITGDGVNDAPALRKADIGVAMGIAGTDVSKEASDLVLLDDNFATIVQAVKEGRTIHGNIRTFIHFVVAGNIGKGLVMLLSPFLSGLLPLLPLQLLWLNILMDGLLGFGMIGENSEEDVMKRKPISQNETMFSGTFWTGVLIGLLALGIGAWYFFDFRREWQTMIFASLGFMQVFHALALRSQTVSFFKRDFLNSPSLIGMALLVVVLQLAAMYLPAFATFFEVMPLKLSDLFLTVLPGLIVFIVLKWRRKVKSD